MSLPSFLTRIHNAAGPHLAALGESELGARLEEAVLVLEIDAEGALNPGLRAGYLLAANLGARLYSDLRLDAPSALADDARALALRVNPGCGFDPEDRRALTLSWRAGEPNAETVRISAEGWNLGIDQPLARSGPAAAPAAMAAAAIGIGELFRALFADLLPHGRSAPEPFALDLVGLGEPGDAPMPPARIDLGKVHLAGCGAIGQAAVATLAELPVAGTLVAVDHEQVDLGNLQRYLLSGEDDVGASKPRVVKRALASTRMKVVPVGSRWGEDKRTAPGRDTVLSALDSKQGRIELAGGLHRRIFNAWTQPEDLGVSRHLDFGHEPCLACIAWPRRARPSESERIAEALGESELRVVCYLVSGKPVGVPLPPDQLQGTVRLPLPSDAGGWSERSLLGDLTERYGLDPEALTPLAGLSVRALYRDAVCAGMLLEHRGTSDEEIAVPLAHQSALAGILLATWLIIDRVPELRTLCPVEPQARYDVMRGGPQIWSLLQPREPRCICFDPDFLAADAALRA